MTKDSVSSPQLGLWALCLTMAAMGIRNFEPGLTTDAPLYATIGRSIVETGNLVHLDGKIPDFVPFAEHPHLFFWLLAGVFSVFPAADWSARIVGHVFYFGFIWLFAVYLQKERGTKTAVWSVILLWSWYRVSNFFSNVYPDPALLFCGFSSIVLFDWGLGRRARPILWAAASGVAMGLAALSKGLAIGGFLPAILLLWILATRKEVSDWRRFVFFAAAWILALCTVLLIYYLVIRSSSAPDFLSLYWRSQMTGRIQRIWSFFAVWEWRGWKGMMVDTYYLILLTPFILTRWKAAKEVALPLCLFLTFVFLYAGSGMAGTQYWLTVLPWVAWMIADGVFSRLPVSPITLVKVTGTLSLVAVFLAQYAPVNTRRLPPPSIASVIQNVARENPEASLVLQVPPHDINFLASSRMAWYTGKRIHYAQAVDTIPPNTGDIFFLPLSDAEPILHRRHFCHKETRDGLALWAPCLEQGK